jgi:hypothetical protein
MIPAEFALTHWDIRGLLGGKQIFLLVFRPIRQLLCSRIMLGQGVLLMDVVLPFAVVCTSAWVSWMSMATVDRGSCCEVFGEQTAKDAANVSGEHPCFSLPEQFDNSQKSSLSKQTNLSLIHTNNLCERGNLQKLLPATDPVAAAPPPPVVHSAPRRMRGSNLLSYRTMTSSRQLDPKL